MITSTLTADAYEPFGLPMRILRLVEVDTPLRAYFPICHNLYCQNPWLRLHVLLPLLQNQYVNPTSWHPGSCFANTWEDIQWKVCGGSMWRRDICRFCWRPEYSAWPESHDQLPLKSFLFSSCLGDFHFRPYFSSFTSRIHSCCIVCWRASSLTCIYLVSISIMACLFVGSIVVSGRWALWSCQGWSDEWS